MDCAKVDRWARKGIIGRLVLRGGMAREEKAGKGNPLYRPYALLLNPSASPKIISHAKPSPPSQSEDCLLILAPEGGATEFDNDIDFVAENLLTAVFLLLHLVSLRFLGLSGSLWASRDCGSLPRKVNHRPSRITLLA